MVHPIAQGDRGPAVEDVQKRLLTLGFDLGPTGVDGVFWGATLTAVRRFQADHSLDEDGVVGNETWAALVDATFRLGDRLLGARILAPMTCLPPCALARSARSPSGNISAMARNWQRQRSWWSAR